eukprot:jgi/Botrbrau1/10392/Bobra.0133s0001.1
MIRCSLLWDTRVTIKPAVKVEAHDAEVNCLDFNPFNEFVLATGSADKDGVHLRHAATEQAAAPAAATTQRRSSKSAGAPRTRPSWVPAGPTAASWCGTLAASATSSRQRTRRTVPPELLFIHGGHTSKVSDFAWNPSIDWVIASVAEDNILQIWQMSENIYEDDYMAAARP